MLYISLLDSYPFFLYIAEMKSLYAMNLFLLLEFFHVNNTSLTLPDLARISPFVYQQKK